jgi:hypothetical protein
MLYLKPFLLVSLLLPLSLSYAGSVEISPHKPAPLSSQTKPGIAPKAVPLSNQPQVIPSIKGKQSLKVEVKEPAENLKYFTGNQLPIRWDVLQTPSKQAKIDIIMEQIGVQKIYQIASGIDAIKEQYSWKIKLDAGAGRKEKIKRFRIKLIDSHSKGVLSMSDVFQIEHKVATVFSFTSPKAALKINWCKGNSYPVSWTSTNLPAGSYNIDLFEERTDQIRIPVAQGVGPNGSIIFNANHTNQGAATLRMIFHNDRLRKIFPSLITYSNHPFALGNVYTTQRGNPIPIYLTQVCATSGSLSIQLLDANHQVIDTIADNIPPAGGGNETNYMYHQTNVPPGTYYVRATDGTNHFDRQFSIR